MNSALPYYCPTCGKDHGSAGECEYCGAELKERTSEDKDLEPLLDECPGCEGDNLRTADEVGETMWDDTDTACDDCERVYDARGRFSGGFNSEVAQELFDSLTDAISGDSDE